jgi:WD40 repeat protein
MVLLACIMILPALAVEPLWTAKASPGLDLTAVAISWNGSLIVAGGDQLVALSRDGQKLWSGWSGELLDLDRDGRYIVSSQGTSVRLVDSKGIKLWDRSIMAPVADISISPDGLIIAAGGGGVVQSWHNSGSGLGYNLTDRVKRLRISPVKDQIVVVTEKALRGFNLSYVPFWWDDEVRPEFVGISADGTGIVAAGGNRIWYYHGSGTRLWNRQLADGNIIALAYSRDGSTIVSGHDDYSVMALDRDGITLWSAKAGFWVTSVGVSDNGSVIAAGSMDKKMYVFDRKGTLLGTFEAAGMIKSRSVGVSGDGSRIVAVDGRNIYCFSGDQFSGPVSTVIPVTALNQPAAATPPIPRAETGANVTATSAPGQEQALPLVPAATQRSGIPWMVALIPLAVTAFLRQRRV